MITNKKKLINKNLIQISEAILKLFSYIYGIIHFCIYIDEIYQVRLVPFIIHRTYDNHSQTICV
jgi:DMSO/TMAO reductase YedYZ heme-binding membrane subunit